jgi:hypothetical protein
MYAQAAELDDGFDESQFKKQIAASLYSSDMYAEARSSCGHNKRSLSVFVHRWTNGKSKAVASRTSTESFYKPRLIKNLR